MHSHVHTILCHVSMLLMKTIRKRTINIRRGQNKQSTTSRTLTNGRQHGRKKVRQNHSQTGLNILQCRILSSPTTMHLVTRLEVGHSGKQVRQGGDNGVEIEVDMVGSDIHGQLLGSISCFLTGVLRTHVTGVEQATVNAG